MYIHCHVYTLPCTHSLCTHTLDTYPYMSPYTHTHIHMHTHTQTTYPHTYSHTYPYTHTPPPTPSQLSFFANALGLKPVSVDRMYQIHTGMVSQGLDMPLFFKVMRVFLGSLSAVGADRVCAVCACLCGVGVATITHLIHPTLTRFMYPHTPHTPSHASCTPTHLIHPHTPHVPPPNQPAHRLKQHPHTHQYTTHTHTQTNKHANKQTPSQELLNIAEVNFRATQVLFEDIIERATTQAITEHLTAEIIATRRRAHALPESAAAAERIGGGHTA